MGGGNRHLEKDCHPLFPFFCYFQFTESWRLLVDWMTEVEQTLDTHKDIGASHKEIKQQLIEQKV